METINTIRTYRRGEWTVRIVAHPEWRDVADTVAFGDTAEAVAAEREYINEVRTGVYPWICLGAHVSFRGHEFGSAYLGCVDTWEWRDVGFSDFVREAIQEARNELDAIKGGSK